MQRLIYASRYDTPEKANASMPGFDSLNRPYYRRLGDAGTMKIEEILDYALKHFGMELDKSNGTPYLYLREADGTVVRIL